MKKLIRFLLIIILILSLLIIYARYGGTRGLITKEYQIETTIDDSFDGLKIVHFSDLHYLRITNKETTQSIIEEINLLNPDIVVLDEPTNALDDDGKEMVKSVVRKQKERGALVIISCHDMQTLEELSDEIVKLKEGRICG